MKREQHLYGLVTQYYYISILPTDLQIQYNLIKIPIYNSNNKQHSFKKLLKILCGPFFKSVLVCYGIASCFFLCFGYFGHGMSDLSSPTRDRINPLPWKQSLNQGSPQQIFFSMGKGLE